MEWFTAHQGAAGILLLLAFAIFPRITMFFAMATPFNVLAWVGWFVAPQITVAVFAYLFYANTNPGLVACAIIWAVLSTGAKGGGAASKSKSQR